MLLRLISDLLRRPNRSSSSSVSAAGAAHYARGELEHAEHCFREAIKLDSDDVGLRAALAVTLRDQQKFRSALPVLISVIERQPDLAAAHAELGVCYSRLARSAEAISHLERAVELEPELHIAHAALAEAYLDACEWDSVERWQREFLRYRELHPDAWAQRIEPFTALTLFPGTIAKEVARQHALSVARAVTPLLPPPTPKAAPDARIRVGYVSWDFHNHATAHLAYRLFESHDRDRVEVFAYSFGPDDGSDYRKHLERTCDRFVDIRGLSSSAAAERIRADAIDVLVDMKGYTAFARPQIFALRPAPVQVSYLGYPGTMGAAFIDYFISDAVATPKGFEAEFTECIVRLPDSYQVNDSRQRIAPLTLSRADLGLPESGPVFCSFNRLSKIDRTIFSVWMEVLREVPTSVLWLRAGGAEAERNLRTAAVAMGVAAERIVFTPSLPKPEHLARHRLADLFLDTTAYNAHTGASDALWAGLPVLTCPGATFATRVAASLLHACDLPELAVGSLDSYRAAAIHYARDPQALAAVTMKLRNSLPTARLFQTRPYVAHLESAFVHMHARRAAGFAPESFSV